MLEALWSVEFAVPSKGNYGAGVIIFENGRLYGGDSSYYYVGNYLVNDGIVVASLKVKHYSGSPENVMGFGIKENIITAAGAIAYDTFKVSNNEFVAILTRRAELPA